MGSFDHLKGTYFEECAELLEAAYAHFSAIREGRSDGETIHAIFRAIHSIKGGGGAFGFERMVAFAHQFETVLDLVRDGRLALSSDVATLLERSTDVLSDLIASARAEIPAAAGFEDELLQALTSAAASPAAQPAAIHRQPDHAAQAMSAAVSAPGAGLWRIRFVPHANVFRSANEPLLIIRALMRMGPVKVLADLSRMPDLEELDPTEAYLAWTIQLETAEPRQAIEEAFDFVADDSDLLIEAVDAAPLSAPPDKADERPVLAVTHPAAGPSSPLPPAAVHDAAPASHASIRVDVEKVDRLVNLVGEMVINQSMLVQRSTSLPPELCGGLLNGLETMSQHLRELQEGVMGIRAQPVRSVFSRMSRLVREVSTQLGKEVRLVVTGEGTEIDKTVIEQLADPLTHLLRNALDHGIEKPDIRVAAGKPRHGTVHLSAEHRGGRIVIEIADDGRGIDRARVLAKARERGLVAADAVLTNEEVDHLIFLPGFSTVEKVSDLSGRGVGMDVVKRNIQGLGGRIAIESRDGAGSRFLLSLPLTLAILDGMAVAVGAEIYIVPITNVIESLRPRPGSIHSIPGHGDVLVIRGMYIPLLYLHRNFMVPGAVTDPCEGIVVIVESEGAARIGLVVDELVGQQQVVVKSLEANYGTIEGFGGATILGDGRVALILDPSSLHDTAPAASSRPAGFQLAAEAALASGLH